PRLPVMVLLENEVKDLADAHVYLDQSNPKAALATDLLLATQGWRRFATAGAGSLSGTVMDPTNTLIPGATVRAQNTVNGSILTAMTNAQGAYSFSNIQSGTYRVSASLPGFQTQTVGLLVTHNSSERRDFRLALAMNFAMVEVMAMRANRVAA